MNDPYYMPPQLCSRHAKDIDSCPDCWYVKRDYVERVEEYVERKKNEPDDSLPGDSFPGGNYDDFNLERPSWESWIIVAVFVICTALIVWWTQTQ